MTLYRLLTDEEYESWSSDERARMESLRANNLVDFERMMPDPQATADAAAWAAVRAAINFCSASLLVCIDAFEDPRRGDSISDRVAARIFRAIVPILKREEEAADDAVSRSSIS